MRFLQKLPSLVLGLLATGSFALPAFAQQLIYDISPQYGHLEVYGYQQSVLPAAQPVTTPMVAPVTGGGATGGGVSYSGGLSSFGIGPGGPAQQFTIYNPVAVAGMQGVTSRADQTPSWPPRGGPWGVGLATTPPPATPAAQTAEPTTAAGPTPEEDSPEEGETAPPSTGLAASPPRLIPRYMDQSTGAAGTTVRPAPNSPVDRYLPSALVAARDAADRSWRNGSRLEGRPSPPARGAAALAPVYRQQAAAATSEPLPEPDAQREAERAGTPVDRQLDPIYRQQESTQEQ